MKDIPNDIVFKEALRIFSRINKVREADLLTASRKRELVDTRTQVCAYCRMRTTMTCDTLGKFFGRNHSTVVNSLKVHHMYMEIVRSSRSLARVNENYAQDFEEGMEELDERFKVARMITPGLKYEVHMYVDQWPDWESAKVLSIKEISETQFEAQSVK